MRPAISRRRTPAARPQRERREAAWDGCFRDQAQVRGPVVLAVKLEKRGMFARPSARSATQGSIVMSKRCMMTCGSRAVLV
jgi:hypothetical protein